MIRRSPEDNSKCRLKRWFSELEIVLSSNSLNLKAKHFQYFETISSLPSRGRRRMQLSSGQFRFGSSRDCSYLGSLSTATSRVSTKRGNTNHFKLLWFLVRVGQALRFGWSSRPGCLSAGTSTLQDCQQNAGVFRFFMVDSSLSLEREDFKLDDLDIESRKWKSPHSDIFAFSDDTVVDELSELSGTARGTVACDKLHAAVEACQSRVLNLGQQVRNTDVFIQRFIKHVVRIYDESMENHKGIIMMKVTDEDVKTLKSFADDGKFVSHSYNNVLELLRSVLTVPSKSMLDRLGPLMNFFAHFLKLLLDGAVYVFQEIRVLLMQFVFSSDVVIYSSMILPPLVLFLSMRRGHSGLTVLLSAVVTVMVISYFVELRSAIETARAKDMAKMIRGKNIPPECRGGEVGYYDWIKSIIQAPFSPEDRCEKYFLDQVPETMVQPYEVFWKVMFTPLTVCMNYFGRGLNQFIATYTEGLGWFTKLAAIPVGMIAVLIFIALIFLFLGGGAMELPFFSRIRFSGPGRRVGEPFVQQPNAPPQQAIPNNPQQVITYNYYAPLQMTATPDLNMSVSVPGGSTLQMIPAASSNSDNIPSSSSSSGSGPSQDVRQAKLAINGVKCENAFQVCEQQTLITALPGLSIKNVSAGSSKEVEPYSKSFPETDEQPREFRRHPRLSSQFSETNWYRSYDSNHCALEEVGSGDFLSRDLTHPTLPSGLLRWRRHHRKFSI